MWCFYTVLSTPTEFLFFNALTQLQITGVAENTFRSPKNERIKRVFILSIFKSRLNILEVFSVSETVSELGQTIPSLFAGLWISSRRWMGG